MCIYIYGYVYIYIYTHVTRKTIFIYSLPYVIACLFSHYTFDDTRFHDGLELFPGVLHKAFVSYDNTLHSSIFYGLDQKRKIA